MGKENTKPSRLLAGQRTMLGRTMHDIRYDPVNDEFMVTNPFAQAILIYKGNADGDTPPVRIIQGSKTQLAGAVYSGLDRLEVDWVNNEIVVGIGEAILTFPRTANGDVAPLRVIKGPNAQLRGVQTVVVDPVSNVYVAGGNYAGGSSGQMGVLGAGGGMATYPRLGNGDVPPKTVIVGPKTEIVRINQMAMIPQKGWIVASQPGAGGEQEPKNTFVGVWHVSDNGDVAPKWKIGGPKTMLKKPRGVTLNFKDKEVIVADMRTNSVLTFAFPAIF
jgi:hypothetical protein